MLRCDFLYKLLILCGCTTPAGGASNPTFWTTSSVLPSASSPYRLLCTVRCVLGPCSVSSARPGFRPGVRIAALDLPIRYSINNALTLGLDIAPSCLSIALSLNRIVNQSSCQTFVLPANRPASSASQEGSRTSPAGKSLDKCRALGVSENLRSRHQWAGTETPA